MIQLTMKNDFLSLPLNVLLWCFLATFHPGLLFALYAAK
jgi:uncharacterized membrane protein YqaE (UPF0057 family)